LLDYTTIGRARDNAFVIDDAYASQHHAELVFDDRSWWLVNLGSTNGSYLNGNQSTTGHGSQMAMSYNSAAFICGSIHEVMA
jgi:pSer/pThr/pTyr-binding forkhead associated (FHA) protein